MFLHQIFLQGLRRKMENWPTLKLGKYMQFTQLLKDYSWSIEKRVHAKNQSH